MNWIEIVQSLGFPILASCACGWYVKYITDKNDDKTEKQAKYFQENLDKMETRHSESLEKIMEALNNNKNVKELEFLQQQVNDNNKYLIENK